VPFSDAKTKRMSNSAGDNEATGATGNGGKSNKSKDNRSGKKGRVVMGVDAYYCRITGITAGTVTSCRSAGRAVLLLLAVTRTEGQTLLYYWSSSMTEISVMHTPTGSSVMLRRDAPWRTFNSGAG
jgi:hypothetical protein